jgi:transcriptional regulator with XRE-family HTH domain
MARHTLDTAALYRAIDTGRQVMGLSWRGLAANLGLSSSTFTRLAQGHRPDADGLLTILVWLRASPEVFAVDRWIGTEDGGMNP